MHNFYRQLKFTLSGRVHIGGRRCMGSGKRVHTFVRMAV